MSSEVSRLMRSIEYDKTKTERNTIHALLRIIGENKLRVCSDTQDDNQSCLVEPANDSRGVIITVQVPRIET